LREVTGVPILNNKIIDNESHDFYFTYHHSAGDSMLMMNAEDLDDNVVAIANLMYLIADLDEPIPKD
jgi:carboxypeptidase Q